MGTTSTWAGCIGSSNICCAGNGVRPYNTASALEDAGPSIGLSSYPIGSSSCACLSKDFDTSGPSNEARPLGYGTSLKSDTSSVNTALVNDICGGRFFCRYLHF